ncbi:MAG: LiaF domain-containing protein [Acidobacteriota bacterium]
MKPMAHSRLIFGGIALVLLAGCVDFDDDRDSNSRMTNFRQERPVSAEKSVDYRLENPVGTLQLSLGGAGKVFDLDADYDERKLKPEFRYDVVGDRGDFSFKFESATDRARNASKTNLRLRVSPDLASSFWVRAGVGKSEVDLTKVRLKRLQVESGVGETVVSVYEPNPERCDRIELKAGVGSFQTVGLGNANFRELNFEGGVGEADLDLTGQWTNPADIDIKVGIGSVEVTLPRELGVELRVSKNFMSGLSLQDFDRRGDNEYVSENFAQSKVHVRINVETGIGGVVVRWK